MFDDAPTLLLGDTVDDGRAERLLQSIGFARQDEARRRLRGLGDDESSRAALTKCLPMLLAVLTEAATPDGSLVNFDRFAQSVPDRARLFGYLAENPRAVEILVKLFVGSQFLTEILLRNPDYLERLTAHRRLAEFKSREQFREDARQTAGAGRLSDRLDALRRFQRWEFLRIGACDSFGLMDLKMVTLQLSLLADGIVQACLQWLTVELGVEPDGFAVLALGKLGGEELNYSSDIDLVFVARDNAARFWPLGQRLIKSLIDATAEGFLYRVDMRLRPWGRSGALVTSADAYVEYLRRRALPWERQALLKARPIAGDLAIGDELLRRVEPIVFGGSVNDLRASIRGMKQRIEAELSLRGRSWGEVKSGAGSIRDVEFVTQFLQLAYGDARPEIRSPNTIEALVRLADAGLLRADEYRQLTGGYVLLRKIEHALQLMHNKPVHTLPDDRRELAYLARRLDFPDPDEFGRHYDRHCAAIRTIYDRHIGGGVESSPDRVDSSGEPAAPHVARMEPSYQSVFSADDIARHAALLARLSPPQVVALDAAPAGDGLWQLTIVGFDHPGDLSLMCGLLFVFGFNIVDGQVFTGERISTPCSGEQDPTVDRPPTFSDAERKFVNVLTVRPPQTAVLPEVWTRYAADLSELLELSHTGRLRDAQGRLARRVAGAIRDVPGMTTSLFPVEVQIDNEASERSTVLSIRTEDTPGFLYELTNALALVGIDISRVIVRSRGNRVFDTLSVTDTAGRKIVHPQRQAELRAAAVLIKHFTHLLPRSSNAEQALLQFRNFLEQLFRRPNWVAELSSLERSDVLDALARLLGVSSFLWEDFLRLQHENLFPIVRDIGGLARPTSREQLAREVWAALSNAADGETRRDVLNAFKDRQMFRIDMRHIVGHIPEFGEFSAELTDLAEVVVEAACRLCLDDLHARFGRPLQSDATFDNPLVCPFSVCALGKCGGRELGFASDIELMFLFEGNGRTNGAERIGNPEFFQKLVEHFVQTIRARRAGIFQIDLRLRPYGQASPLAVSLDAFRNYFAAPGAAWPYERQALVKLRPIAGDKEFGRQIVRIRDELIYSGDSFDTVAMRAMREKQVQQLVQPGTFNAKLSPGGLVDAEYLVQGLQITHGHRDASLRATNTVQAMAALHAAGILTTDEHTQLREAYIFLRQLIDALRVVRGDARDLTIPTTKNDELLFLARRLGYGGEVTQFSGDLERFARRVAAMARLLDRTTPN